VPPGRDRLPLIEEEELTERLRRPFRYAPAILDALLAHGIRPRSTTPPELVHEFVSDLYRYELRRLRDRLTAGEFPKNAYFGRVVELRRQYPLVSLKPDQFLVTEAALARP
jgi:hypothetical protein